MSCFPASCSSTYYKSIPCLSKKGCLDFPVLRNLQLFTLTPLEVCVPSTLPGWEGRGYSRGGGPVYIILGGSFLPFSLAPDLHSPPLHRRTYQQRCLNDVTLGKCFALLFQADLIQPLAPTTKSSSFKAGWRLQRGAVGLEPGEFCAMCTDPTYLPSPTPPCSLDHLAHNFVPIQTETLVVGNMP